ncbi:hypothetical protein MBLNU13_g02311t1 [Cladosporium sp. NU13]
MQPKACWHLSVTPSMVLRGYLNFVVSPAIGVSLVVRIPAAPQYTLISQQIEKLYATIRTDCEVSHEAKRRARLLTNSDELNLYLQSGFDHFAAHIDVPFNFMQVSLLRNPIPKDFGGHILQLCEALNSRVPSREPTTVRWVFKELSVVLASCVLLDCARFRKGQLHELFSSYACFFEYAISESVKARHKAKGHQDERGIIAAGDYVSAFDDTFVQGWMDQLRTSIDDLHRTFSEALNQSAPIAGNVELSEERVAFAIHVTRLDRFYRSIGPATWSCDMRQVCPRLWRAQAVDTAGALVSTPP